MNKALKTICIIGYSILYCSSCKNNRPLTADEKWAAMLKKNYPKQQTLICNHRNKLLCNNKNILQNSKTPKQKIIRYHKLKNNEYKQPQYHYYSYSTLKNSPALRNEPITLVPVDGLSPHTHHTTKKYYRIRSGDSLEKISLKYYGKKSAWRTIYNANRNKIKSPNKIPKGVTIIIPTNHGNSSL